MLDALIRFSLNNRLLILVASVAMVAIGATQLARLPVDIFPDLNQPIVTVLAEAHGLAPEEVETLVTLPLESALGGMPGVVQVRSTSSSTATNRQASNGLGYGPPTKTSSPFGSWRYVRRSGSRSTYSTMGLAVAE